MKRTIKPLIFATIVAGLFSSCVKEIEKYERPDWLKGKLYSQIIGIQDLDSFAICVQKIGYDTIINTSGLFTIFAPTNQAFQDFFQDHPKYKKISDIPFGELEGIVKYHIIQNSWSLTQLMSLSLSGWIDPFDSNSKIFLAFKRQTIYKGKYVPFFFDSYLKSEGLSGSDYDFYFKTAYSPGNMHFAGAHIIGQGSYAENGILYSIDKVISPLKNARELLQAKYSDYSYSDFLNMTSKYPSWIFNTGRESTNPSGTSATYSLYYHFGLIAPTNKAISDLYAQVIIGPEHWPNTSSVPSFINRIIVNTHTSERPIYPTNFTRGFLNGEGDYVVLDPSDINQADYANNSTFIGVNKAIIPRVFLCVAAPVYLRPDYSIYRDALEYSKLIYALKRKNENFSLFVVSNTTLEQDSSLLGSGTKFTSLSISEGKSVSRDFTSLLIQLLNHVSANNPEGFARKEFIPNLNGNYIVFDRETGFVSGGVNSVFGYEGDSAIYLTPELINDPTDNGNAYKINGWFNFPQTSIYNAVNSYSEFYKLLDRAKLLDKLYYTLKFVPKGEQFTVFIPSNEALKKYDTSMMTQAELEQFIRFHFIKGNIIFTDGKKSQGYYSTLRIDEVSNPYVIKYSKLSIKPGIDVIDILNDDGTLYYRINEKNGYTNLMVAEDISTTINMTNYITNGVIHLIDTVLVK